MPKSIFDRVMDWPYHPQAIIALSFAGCFVATMQGDGPIWAALVVAAIAAPFAALVLFMPYLAGVMLYQLSLSRCLHCFEPFKRLFTSQFLRLAKLPAGAVRYDEASDSDVFLREGKKPLYTS